MKNLFLLFLAIGVANLGNAQNLVADGSFEALRYTPCDYMNTANNFNAAYTHWKLPSAGTSDVFTLHAALNCYAHPNSQALKAAGYQNPFSGNTMVAILTYGRGCTDTLPNYREYVQNTLANPLKVGSTYYVGMWVSRADSSFTATNNLGFLFTKSIIAMQGYCFAIDSTPQINFTQVITERENWVLLADTFTARANYSHLTIGNFYTDNLTATQNMPLGKRRNAQYFIDDVQVFEVCGHHSHPLAICPGVPLQLNAPIPVGTYVWNTGEQASQITIADTGTYWVETTVAGCTRTDTFTVSPTACYALELPNVFTPNSDGANDFFSPIALLGITTFELHVYNRFGSLVYQSTNLDFAWDGTHNNKPLAAGVYFWHAHATDKNGKTHEANGSLTLMR